MTARAWWRVLGLALVAVTAAGCKGQCRQLSEKQCECAVNTVVRDTCLRNASANESNFPPTAADEAWCAQYVSVCDCRLVDTPQGKINCGYAWPKDAPPAN